jgi:hypothetical protein
VIDEVWVRDDVVAVELPPHQQDFIPLIAMDILLGEVEHETRQLFGERDGQVGYLARPRRPHHIMPLRTVTD